MHVHVSEDSLKELFLCRFEGLNTGHQTFWESPLPTEPS